MANQNFNSYGVTITTPQGNMVLNAGNGVSLRQQAGLITLSSNSPASVVGQYFSNSNAASTAVSLANATVTNITSLFLGRGVYNVWATAAFSGSATASSFACAISSVGNSLPVAPGYGALSILPISVASGGQLPCMPAGAIEIKVAASTTIYLVGKSSFINGNITAYGYIAALRFS